MSSLQEQLLKAGLVDEKKLARARQEKSRKARQSRHKDGKHKARPETPPPAAQSGKAQRDRELNRKRQEALRQKEIAAQVSQLIDANKLDRSPGELPYSFVYRKKVKKIYVTAAQKKQLADGQLAVATHVASDGRKFELVGAAVAEKIAQRDDGCVIDTGPAGQAETADDDPYAKYEVPDDLIW